MLEGFTKLHIACIDRDFDQVRTLVVDRLMDVNEVAKVLSLFHDILQLLILLYLLNSRHCYLPFISPHGEET